jgi:hypothetical protein
MALHFSLSKRRRHYVTSLEPGLIFKACSGTSLGMPSISEGFHAKISLLARRKLTSTLSYLGESVVPMRATLSLELLGVDEDHLDTLRGFKRSGRPLGDRRFLGSRLVDDRELLGGDNRRGVFIALNFTLVSMLEGGADGDDPTWA